MELQMHGTGGTVNVSDTVFARDFNPGLVHQVVTSYMAGGRAGTKAQKSRSEVRGGGAKPWRQKGTGRARQGTARAVQFVGGGLAFPAKPRDYSKKLNKKMYRAGMRAIFSELVRQDRLVVVEDFGLDSHKTKDLAQRLVGMGLSKVLIVADEVSENLFLAARNLPHVDVCDVPAVDPVSLVHFDRVLVTVGALRHIEEWLG
jgi:large subunit ribosomal protein L4